MLEPLPCAGAFAPYGEGCPGSGGFEPQLAGFGCPEGGREILLGIQQGLGGAAGGLAIGTGTGVLPLTPSCALQVLPLLPVVVPLALAGDGAGKGAAQLAFLLPPGVGAFDLHVQALFLDPGASDLVASSRPLHVHGG